MEYLTILHEGQSLSQHQHKQLLKLRQLSEPLHIKMFISCLELYTDMHISIEFVTVDSIINFQAALACPFF